MRARAQRVEHERVVGVDGIGKRDRRCGFHGVGIRHVPRHPSCIEAQRALLDFHCSVDAYNREGRSLTGLARAPLASAACRLPAGRAGDVTGLAHRRAPAPRIDDVEHSLLHDPSYKVRVDAALVLGRLRPGAVSHAADHGAEGSAAGGARQRGRARWASSRRPDRARRRRRRSTIRRPSCATWRVTRSASSAATDGRCDAAAARRARHPAARRQQAVVRRQTGRRSAAQGRPCPAQPHARLPARPAAAVRRRRVQRTSGDVRDRRRHQDA